MPAVSVIMPAWNAEAYLGAAIESVLAQTRRDFELIVVDDGSTDRTAAVAAACAQRDPRVRLLSQRNGGPSVARNHGMEMARGEWLAFLDSDDLWEPTFLDAQLAVFAAHPGIDLVTGNAWYLGGPLDGRPVRPVGTGLGRGRAEAFPFRSSTVSLRTPTARAAECAGREGPPFDSLPLRLQLTDGTEPLSLLNLIEDEAAVFIMTVFRRTVFDRIGGLDADLLTSEDYEFWIRAARAGFRYRRNPAPLGWYRQRTGSLSASEVRMLRGILQAYRIIGPTLEPGSPERGALERQIRRFSLELVAAETRVALETGDAADAADRLVRLHDLRGGFHLLAAAALLRVAPRTALGAYRLRDALRRTRIRRPSPGTVLTPAHGEAR